MEDTVVAVDVEDTVVTVDVEDTVVTVDAEEESFVIESFASAPVQERSQQELSDQQLGLGLGSGLGSIVGLGLLQERRCPESAKP